MIYKYLKSSGGDWSTVADMNAAVIALVNAGLTDHYTIRVENGVSFTGQVNWTFLNSGRFNGKTITLTSDEGATPGIISCTTNDSPLWVIQEGANPESDSGGVIIDRLIWKVDGVYCSVVEPFSTIFLNANRYFTYQNNLFYGRCTDSESLTGLFFCDIEDNAGIVRVINNSFYISWQYVDGIHINLTPQAGSLSDYFFANNFFGAYTIHALTVGTGKNTNNHVYSYDGVDTFSVTGTPVNLTRGVNPNTVNAVIQASRESVATMSARNPHTTLASVALIEQASAVYAPAYDLELNSRL
jgi:hypothetical protein